MTFITVAKDLQLPNYPKYINHIKLPINDLKS